MACLFLNCNKPTKTNSKNDSKLWKMLKNTLKISLRLYKLIKVSGDAKKTLKMSL